MEGKPPFPGEVGELGAAYPAENKNPSAPGVSVEFELKNCGFYFHLDPITMRARHTYLLFNKVLKLTDLLILAMVLNLTLC